MLTDIRQAKQATWLLSGQLADEEPVRHIRVDTSRCLVGRRADATLRIPRSSISREHAELLLIDGQLHVRDLGSTNGTFVNGVRIYETRELGHGDLVQFGQVIFRVTQQASTSSYQTVHDDSCDRALALIQFDQLMTQRAVACHYQPIVSMHDRHVLGFEVLGRSRLFGLKDPASMFAAAKMLNVEGELSRMLREEGVRGASVFPKTHVLFFNTHPIEMDDIDLLIFSLHQVRGLESHRPMVLEIHEAAVTNREAMIKLKAALADLRIGLAYDDFGAGQARLVELVEVSPDYLKFDMVLVQHLESASLDRQRMLASLVRMVLDLGIKPLAEGIETPGDHEICRQMGFTCAQGFLYGRPVLPSAVLESIQSRAPAADDTALDHGAVAAESALPADQQPMAQDNRL
jgi:EAL domain-containing protein (putative c-di-GMP-specific phosphodiesterase class I)